MPYHDLSSGSPRTIQRIHVRNTAAYNYACNCMCNCACREERKLKKKITDGDTGVHENWYFNGTVRREHLKLDRLSSIVWDGGGQFHIVPVR